MVRDRPYIRSVLVGVGSLSLVACQQSMSTATSEDQLRSPQTVPGNDLVIPGCCSLNATGWTVEENMSDSISRTIARNGASVGLGFGPFESGETPSGAEDEVIDGVRTAIKQTKNDQSRKYILTAEVPPSEEGQAANLQPYKLRMEGECSNEEACMALDQLFTSLRF